MLQTGYLSTRDLNSGKGRIISSLTYSRNQIRGKSARGAQIMGLCDFIALFFLVAGRFPLEAANGNLWVSKEDHYMPMETYRPCLYMQINLGRVDDQRRVVPVSLPPCVLSASVKD